MKKKSDVIFNSGVPRLRIILPVLILLIVVSGSIAIAGQPQQGDPLAWPKINRLMKPWTWWWWPGSAVDTANIARQLKIFQRAGLGGVQIIPIYGVKGWESHYIDFLSPEWMRMMGYTVAESHRLGMGTDMALETGWCFGGPVSRGKYANALVVEKTFNLSGGEHLTDTLSASATQALMAFGPGGRIVDLTGKIRPGGHVDWTAPEGIWRVVAVSQRFSGQDVKRAAPGGYGPMLNPFYPPALKRYTQWFDTAFSNYGGPKPHAVFQDSYEYRCNWSPDFFSQFEKFRGYKLQDVLPALFSNDSTDEVARVKSDYRQTVSDIMTVKTDPIWIVWAHKHGFKVSYQAHGAPANWLDLYAEANIPETEMFHLDRNPLISKFASSAAHVAGHALGGAETGTWLNEHFTVTLAELKHLTDDMFISGINHIFYHGTCYSPAAAPWPGWLFYASTEMNPRNSIWYDVSTLNKYVARCQSILQAGRPDNDILLYWPISDQWNDPKGMLQSMTMGDTAWFSDHSIGATAKNLWDKGYSFDYISDRQLKTAKPEAGKVRVPGGDYRVIYSPPCRLMPVGTLQKLLHLAGSGATIIFESHLPEDVPGWGHLTRRREEFKKLLSEIKLNEVKKNLTEAKIGIGRILVGGGEEALEFAGITRERMTDHSGLFFIRRAFRGGKYYFIANRHETDINGWVTIAYPAKSVVIMDPLTGKTGIAAVRKYNGLTQVYLQLTKGSSVILRAFESRKVRGREWKYREVEGPSTEIIGDWHVTFIRGGPVLPASYTAVKPGSWTAAPDTDAQRFAGTAKYEITFDAPGSKGGSYLLNLGKVCQSARVKLNGKNLGTLIIPPFNLPVELKPAGNRLDVEVTNVSANRIRDLDRRGVKWKTFHDINFVNINYKPFNAADWPLYDSGLLGPVTVSPVGIINKTELDKKN